MKAEDPYPNPPVIILRGAAYAPPQPEPRNTPPPLLPFNRESGYEPPTATIPCALIGGSILVVLAIVCLLAGVGMDWLRAVAQ